MGVGVVGGGAADLTITNNRRRKLADVCHAPVKSYVADLINVGFTEVVPSEVLHTRCPFLYFLFFIFSHRCLAKFTGCRAFTVVATSAQCSLAS